MPMLAWVAFGPGAVLCVVNFHLSFLRYPLHRMRGLPKESYRPVSGFPLIGSLLVALSLIELHGIAWMTPAAVALILIDTGGIHWFAASLIYRRVQARKSR